MSNYLPAFTPHSQTSVSAIVTQNSGAVYISYSFIEQLSATLAEALEADIIKINGKRVISLDTFNEVGKIVARDEPALSDFSWDLSKELVINALSDRLIKNNASLVYETNAAYQKAFKGYCHYRAKATDIVFNWLDDNKINEATNQFHHRGIIGKLTNRIYKELDGRHAGSTREMINAEKEAPTTHTTSSERVKAVGLAFSFLPELIEMYQPKTVEDMYDLASRAGLNASLNYAAKIVPVRVSVKELV